MVDAQIDITNALSTMVMSFVDERIDRIKHELKMNKIRENIAFITIDEFCEITKLKRSTVYQYMNDGLISYYRPNNKHVYFSLEDLTNFVFNPSCYHKSKTQLRQ